MENHPGRRAFLKHLTAIGGFLLFSPASFGSDRPCSAANCFDTDFISFGYDGFFQKYLKYCNSANREKIITGISVPMVLRDLFQSFSLYKAVNISQDRLNAISDNYLLFQIEGELGGQIPFRGIVSRPKSPRGYCVLLHGMASTPERCFSLEKDYMGAIAHKLSEAGFAVWCPFLPQGGNFPSMIEAALMLSGNGLSHHAMLCSLAVCQNSVFSRIGLNPKSSYAIFGASIGGLIALHTSLIDPNIYAIAISGYLRDDNLLKNDPAYLKSLRSGSFFPGNLNPAFIDYAMPSIFKRIPKIPIFFEVGNADAYSSVSLGRKKAYETARKAFGTKENLVKLEVHSGGHEVVGDTVIDWLVTVGHPR